MAAPNRNRADRLVDALPNPRRDGAGTWRAPWVGYCNGLNGRAATWNWSTDKYPWQDFGACLGCLGPAPESLWASVIILNVQLPPQPPPKSLLAQLISHITLTAKHAFQSLNAPGCGSPSCFAQGLVSSFLLPDEASRENESKKKNTHATNPPGRRPSSENISSKLT